MRNEKSRKTHKQFGNAFHGNRHRVTLIAYAMLRSESDASIVKNDKQRNTKHGEYRTCTRTQNHARAHKTINARARRIPHMHAHTNMHPARSIRKHSLPTPTRVARASCELHSIDHWGFLSKTRKPGLIEFRASNSQYLKPSDHYVCFLENRRIVSAATLGTRQENAPPASGQTQAIRC